MAGAKTKNDGATGAAVQDPATDVTHPVAKPMDEPEGGWPADAFTGLPGRFVRDPFTGLRRPDDEVARKAVGDAGMDETGAALG